MRSYVARVLVDSPVRGAEDMGSLGWVAEIRVKAEWFFDAVMEIERRFPKSTLLSLEETE